MGRGGAPLHSRPLPVGGDQDQVVTQWGEGGDYTGTLTPALQYPHGHVCDPHFALRYKCETPSFAQMSDIPYGNPWHGGKWHGTPGLDTGSYVGGSGIV